MTIKRFIAANGLDGNNKSITNVTDPTNAQDVSTKAYSTNATNLVSGTVDPARIANAIAAGASGLMTGSDKTKLDGVASGATANTGTVTTVSVVSANGFAGTVANSGTTPALTLTTSITGVLKGNGTAISAATSGTDYAPGTSGNTTGLVKSTTTTGALTTAVAGTDYQAPVSATGLLKSNGTSGNVSAATSGTDYQAPVSATGLLKSNGTSGNVSAATSGIDYSAGTSSLTTGIVKSTTTTGALTIAVAGTDYIAPYGSTTANYVLASPDGSAGTPSFRALTSTDIPSLAWSKITSGTPTSLSGYGITDAYTKTETDTLLQGLDPKASVKAATTVAGTLATSFANGSVIDNVTLATGNRILIKNQGTASENGIYTVNATGAPTRAVDMDSWVEVPNSFTFVEQGDVNADKGFVCTSDQAGTLGSTDIVWAQFTSISAYVAGTGITVSTNTISITNTAVSANSYGSASSVGTFTVNAQGQLTAAASTSIAIASGAVSGLAASATTDTTNASNIGSGTLGAARLPAFSGGDVTASAGSTSLVLSTGTNTGTTTQVGSASTVPVITVSNKGLVSGVSSANIAISSSAVSGLAASATTDTTSASNIGSGTLGAARLPQFTGGDVTSAAAGTTTLTLGAVGTAGTYSIVTTDSKGRVTSGSSPTTLSGYGITDALNSTSNSLLPIVNGNVGSATATTTATTASQVIDSNAVATYRSVRYTVQVTSSGSYQTSDLLVVHDGSNANVVEYSNINIGTLTTSLASFDANVSGGNVNLLVTPAQATSTVFKMIKTLVNI